MKTWIWLTVTSFLVGVGAVQLWHGHNGSGTIALGAATLLAVDLGADAWNSRRGAK